MACGKDSTVTHLDGRSKMEATEADIPKPHKVSLNFMEYLKQKVI